MTQMFWAQAGDQECGQVNDGGDGDKTQQIGNAFQQWPLVPGGQWWRINKQECNHGEAGQRNLQPK